jgi:peptide/nickel transport system substrate-binding protein
MHQAGASGLLGMVAACSPAENQALAGSANTLVVGQGTEPLALSSAGSIDGGSSVVAPQIFDRLFETDLQGKPVPQLAVSADLSPDGRRASIKLRPDAKWHDGKPVTSRDAAFSLEKIWKAYLPRGQVAFANLTSVETPSPQELVLNFSSPVPYLLAALADGSAQVVPVHLYEGRDILTNPNNLAPVGSGPFIFESWKRGEYIALRRNPDYWGAPRPYLDRLIFRFVAAGAASAVALESGSVQYSEGVPQSDIARFQKDERFSVRAMGPGYSANFFGFAFNLNKPVLRDRRVRQAFAHAIDKDFLVRNIWQNFARAADSPIPPGTEWHAPDLPRYPFDLDRAAALLDEAGLRPDANGVRLTLYNDIMPPSALHPRAAQFIKQSLARIGVRLELRSEDLATYLRRVFTSRDWDTLTFSTGADFDPVLGIQRFYTSSSILPGTPFTNATHYATPEVDGLFQAAQGEMDVEKRRLLYRRIQGIVQTDLPSIPLLFPTRTSVGAKRLQHPVETRSETFADARLV